MKTLKEISEMCELSIPPGDDQFSKGLTVAYRNVIRWIAESKGEN
jgi:hypothetical protein